MQEFNSPIREEQFNKINNIGLLTSHILFVLDARPVIELVAGKIINWMEFD